MYGFVLNSTVQGYEQLVNIRKSDLKFIQRNTNSYVSMMKNNFLAVYSEFGLQSLSIVPETAFHPQTIPSWMGKSFLLISGND